MEATYGVAGMMEWVALIPSGRNIVRVRFSGGSLTGFVVTPALFKTTNPVVMKMIEGSGYFRTGKIRLISKRGEEMPKPKNAPLNPRDVEIHPQFEGEGTVTFSKEKR